MCTTGRMVMIIAQTANLSKHKKLLALVLNLVHGRSMNGVKRKSLGLTLIKSPDRSASARI